jgi:hypothetical protein
MRLVQIRNKAAPSKLISEMSIRRSKSIGNKLGAHAGLPEGLEVGGRADDVAAL